MRCRYRVIGSVLQKVERRDPQSLGEVFERRESEVALSSLDGSEVGPVVAEPLRHGLLAQASLEPPHSKLTAHGLLQLGGHDSDCRGTLLIGLQTDE